jgi:D-alanine-D-alanine ligase-like ATP-grasp enzyme
MSRRGNPDSLSALPAHKINDQREKLPCDPSPPVAVIDREAKYLPRGGVSNAVPDESAIVYALSAFYPPT